MDQAYKEFILTKAWSFFRGNQRDEKGGLCFIPFHFLSLLVNFISAQSKALQAKLVSEYVRANH
jgi:hypothetical protein